MSRCSKKCNEIKAKIDSISGLNDDWIYGNLLALESQVNVIVDSIIKYADEDKFNGTSFKNIEIITISKIITMEGEYENIKFNGSENDFIRLINDGEVIKIKEGQKEIYINSNYIMSFEF